MRSKQHEYISNAENERERESASDTNEATAEYQINKI